MLQITATLGIAFLVAREYLALDPAPAAQRGARIAGLCSLPFLAVFAALFASRVLGFLGEVA